MLLRSKLTPPLPPDHYVYVMLSATKVAGSTKKNKTYSKVVLAKLWFKKSTGFRGQDIFLFANANRWQLIACINSLGYKKKNYIDKYV